MPEHVLDRPVWSALSTRQMPLSRGDARARRFDPVFGPLAAAASASADDRAGLARLPIDEIGLWLLEAGAVEPPPGLVVENRVLGHQMVAQSVPEIAHDFAVLELGDADAAEMQALALLTKPGPFAARTHRLAQFVGVRSEGRLVAMAGERMRPEGYAEISGVCTHPDHRGHGYAAVLSSIVARRVLARGETPFLHTYAGNAGAIRLYEALGFAFRREVTVTVLRRG